MITDLGQSQRRRIPDQLAQHPAALRQRTDCLPRLVIDTEVQEALEVRLCEIEDAEGGVARVGQVPRGLENLTQERLEIELRNQGLSDLQKPPELLFGERIFPRHF